MSGPLLTTLPTTLGPCSEGGCPPLALYLSLFFSLSHKHTLSNTDTLFHSCLPVSEWLNRFYTYICFIFLLLLCVVVECSRALLSEDRAGPEDWAGGRPEGAFVDPTFLLLGAMMVGCTVELVLYP